MSEQRQQDQRGNASATTYESSPHCQSLSVVKKVEKVVVKKKNDNRLKEQKNIHFCLTCYNLGICIVEVKSISVNAGYITNHHLASPI